MKTKKLPRKPSTLVQIALNDLEKCEKNPFLVINMGFYVEPIREGDKEYCAVGFAGAIMVQRLGFSPHASAGIHDVDDIVTADRLHALDLFRGGAILAGFETLGIPLEGLPDRVRICHYADNPKQFKEDIKGLIKLLRAHSL